MVRVCFLLENVGQSSGGGSGWSPWLQAVFLVRVFLCMYHVWYHRFLYIYVFRVWWTIYVGSSQIVGPTVVTFS